MKLAAMNALALTHTGLAFFALALAIISVWVKQSPWIWGSFLIFAFALGYMARVIEPIALAPIGGLLVVHAFLKGDVKGLARFVLVLIASALSLGLMAAFFPGFHPIAIVKNAKISPKAYPFSLYLSFTKPFIGFFILALGFPLVKNKNEFFKVLKIAIPLTLAGVAILIPLALFSGLIQWDPKLPKIFWFFLIHNLIFTCIIEEAFWRGFIQNEFFRWFGAKGFIAPIAAVLITAFTFAGLHYFWVPNIPFLTLVFVAGIIYGSIYQYTRALEASILCHFVFNITHFALFTYPALVSSSS